MDKLNKFALERFGKPNPKEKGDFSLHLLINIFFFSTALKKRNFILRKLTVFLKTGRVNFF